MYHSIYECPEQNIGEQSSKEPVGQKALSRNIVFVPVWSRPYHEHDPQDHHSKYIECKPI